MRLKDSEARHWPVLVASCVTAGLTHGMASSMGVFYIEWHTEFPEGSALIGWLSSSMLAMLLCFSPFAGALTKYFRVQLVVCAGSLLSFSGLFISSFATEIYLLFLTIPFLTGIGFGMSYTGLMVIISEYFHKHYALANGICTTGASIGMVLMPIVFRFLIDMYSWRGAMMVTSAIQINVIICSRFMKQPSRQKEKPVVERRSNQIASAPVVQDYAQLQGDERVNDLKMTTDACTSQMISSSSTSEAQPVNDCGLGTHESENNIGLTPLYRCSQRLCSFLNHTGISLFWTNRVFSLFMLIIVLNSLIFGITLPYLAAQAKLVGIPDINATFLISILGISSIVSRLTHGRLVDAHIIQPVYIYCFFVLLAAIGAPVIGVVNNYVWFVICTSLIGLSAGVYIPLQAVMIRIIIGKDRFPGGFGISLVVVSVGNMSSAYIGGYYFDVTGSYSVGFYLVGITAGLAIVLALAMHLLWTKCIKDDRWPTVNKPSPMQNPE